MHSSKAKQQQHNIEHSKKTPSRLLSSPSLLWYRWTYTMSFDNPSTEALVEAILSNSLLLVENYLNRGCDPNSTSSLIWPLLGDIVGVDYLAHEVVPEDTKMAIQNRAANHHPPTALHAAVINCYHRSKQYKDHQSTARAILRTLLRHGADPSVVATNLVLTNIEDNVYKLFDASDKTPCGLALFLKRFPFRIWKDETHSMMDKVIEILQGRALLPTSIQQPQTQILKATADMYKKLLFSANYSDVHFLCSDGVELHAHRCILAAASEYFDRSFQGPWVENNDNGKWSTAHSSQIMKAVLAFIYKGDVAGHGLLELEPLELFSVAAEYDIPSLIKLAEDRCIQSIKCDNVKDILQEAHLHGNVNIKRACFLFVQTKAARVLTDPEMMDLAMEDPQLWKELTTAIAPSSSGDKENRGPNRKRARTR